MSSRCLVNDTWPPAQTFRSTTGAGLVPSPLGEVLKLCSTFSIAVGTESVTGTLQVVAGPSEPTAQRAGVLE